MGGAIKTRRDDEQLLLMISLRCDGVTSPKIASLVGVTSHTVRTMTNRVLEADLTESGEHQALVAQNYWRGRP